MSRLANRLTDEEAVQVVNAFAQRLNISDAKSEANRLLSRKGFKPNVTWKGIVSFLKEPIAAHLWERYMMLQSKKVPESVIERGKDRLQKVIDAFTKKSPDTSQKPHPPFDRNGDWDDAPTPDDLEFHNYQADEAIWKELRPDYLRHLKEKAERETKQQEYDEEQKAMKESQKES